MYKLYVKAADHARLDAPRVPPRRQPEPNPPARHPGLRLTGTSLATTLSRADGSSAQGAGGNGIVAREALARPASEYALSIEVAQRERENTHRCSLLWLRRFSAGFPELSRVFRRFRPRPYARAHADRTVRVRTGADGHGQHLHRQAWQVSAGDRGSLATIERRFGSEMRGRESFPRNRALPLGIGDKRVVNRSLLLPWQTRVERYRRSRSMVNCANFTQLLR
jgi:hypothetical protein